jgi:thymidylate synthase (FAD)
MKRKNMQVELLDFISDIENKIGAYTRTCTGKSINFLDRTNNEKVMRCALKSEHLSILRFGYATFAIKEISRACSHQLVRIAHAGILQESQRSVKKNITKDQVMFLTDIELNNEWNELSKQLQAFYEKCINSGVKKEDARYIYPEAITTNLVITGNFQTWKHFIKLRTDSSAQWEIRMVALEIQKLLKQIAPSLF